MKAAAASQDAAPVQHKFVTRKSHKSHLRDRSHGVAGISKQGGGRANWGKPLDDVKYMGESLPPADDEEPDMQKAEDVFLRVSEDSERVKFAQSIKDLDRFKETMKLAAQDYLAVQDFSLFSKALSDLALPLYHQDVSYVLLKLGMDKNETDRKHLSQLINTLRDRNLLTDNQITQGFRKIANQLDDLLIDAPLAKEFLQEFISSVPSLSPAVVDELRQTITPDAALVQQTKKLAAAAVAEYFRSSDLSEFKRAISELPAPTLHFEAIKILIRSALDHENHDRQLASKAIAELSGVVVKREQVERAFTVLLERVEDIYLDVPDILALLSCFVARAVADEALSPAFLLRVDLFASDMGFVVVTRAQQMLQLEQSARLLEHVWGDLSDDEDEPASNVASPRI